jgi:hypothetical protein
LGSNFQIFKFSNSQILKNHEVNYITDFQHRQQFNGYDCGPWTVFNIDSMARAGKLSESIKDEDITNQRLSIQPSFQKIEATTNTNTNKAENKEDKEVSELIEGTKQLSLTSPPATDFPLTNIPITTFVINTIAYAPEREFDDDSSDEEDDGTFPDELFNFDSQSKDSIPFTTTIPKYARKKANDFKELPDPTQVWSTSVTVAPFLQKLIQNGFEENDKGKLAASVSVSIGLNRMLSLSTRKNQSLSLELESDVETSVRYEKFGFYWKCNWYNSEGKPVEYQLVQKFYKQLKRIDSEKAQEFIAITERGIPVPYQELREYAKNHTKTKELIGESREKVPNANIYLSLIE